MVVDAVCYRAVELVCLHETNKVPCAVQFGNFGITEPGQAKLWKELLFVFLFFLDDRDVMLGWDGIYP